MVQPSHAAYNLVSFLANCGVILSWIMIKTEQAPTIQKEASNHITLGLILAQLSLMPQHPFFPRHMLPIAHTTPHFREDIPPSTSNQNTNSDRQMDRYESEDIMPGHALDVTSCLQLIGDAIEVIRRRDLGGNWGSRSLPPPPPRSTPFSRSGIWPSRQLANNEQSHVVAIDGNEDQGKLMKIFFCFIANVETDPNDLGGGEGDGRNA
jgi:hypothetical protein